MCLLFHYDVRDKAVQHYDHVKNAPDGWKYCLDKFLHSSNAQVKFFALVVIQEATRYRYHSLNEQDRDLLKTSLLNWLTLYLPKSSNEDAVIKYKFVHVLVLLFQLENPQGWPNFFNDLLSCLNLGPSLIFMFYRILNTLDEEALSKDFPSMAQHLASNIKDAMRQDCVPRLSSIWISTLNTYQNDINLCRECLECIRKYISWIDITIIATDQLIPSFFKYLASSEEALQEEALHCVHEIVLKEIPDPLLKMSLLSKLQLYAVISLIPFGEELSEKVANLVNDLGNVLLSLRDPIQNLIDQQKADAEVSSALQSMLDETILLMFKYLGDESDDVSAAIVPFATSYLRTLKSQQGYLLNTKQLEYLNSFLQIIRFKLKYKPDYNFDNPDEEEQEFMEYRKDLATMYKIIAVLSPQTVAQFVRETIQTVTANLSAAGFADVEVSLTLFYILGEINSAATRQIEAFFVETATLIALGPISTYAHSSVTLAFFDIIVRYEKYLPENPEVLRSILIAFLDNRGIRNPNVSIRNRTCFLFQRFVTKKNVSPFLESIQTALKEFLIVEDEMQKLISRDDQQSLYEAIGHIVGVQLSDTTLAATYLEANITPLIIQLHEIIDKKHQHNSQELYILSIFAATITQIIACIGCYSKGFHGQTHFAPFFKQTLEIVAKVLQEFPKNKTIHAKCMHYMYRMSECFGAEIIHWLAPIIWQILQTSQFAEIGEITMLLTQLMSRFKQQMAAAIDTLLIHILARLSKIINDNSQSTGSEPTNGTLTESEREILHLKKAYYVFLTSIVDHNCASCLISPTNLPYLNGILETIVLGCSELTDLNATKQCFWLLKRLIHEWCSQTSSDQANSNNTDLQHSNMLYSSSSLPSSLLPRFNTWVLEHATGALFNAFCVNSQIDFNDAVIQKILNEIAGIQKVLVIQLGKQYSQYVRSVVLPRLHYPPQAAEDYVTHMENTPLEEFKQIFIDFIVTVREVIEVWKLERYLWIGHLKEEPRYCPLASLPKDIIKEIATHLYTFH